MSKLQERNVANERVYTVEEIAREARISRTAAYELVKKGLFPVIRVGSSIRIPKKPFDAWMPGWCTGLSINSREPKRWKSTGAVRKPSTSHPALS